MRVGCWEKAGDSCRVVKSIGEWGGGEDGAARDGGWGGEVRVGVGGKAAGDEGGGDEGVGVEIASCKGVTVDLRGFGGIVLGGEKECAEGGKFCVEGWGDGKERVD